MGAILYEGYRSVNKDALFGDSGGKEAYFYIGEGL